MDVTREEKYYCLSEKFIVLELICIANHAEQHSNITTAPRTHQNHGQNSVNFENFLSSYGPRELGALYMIPFSRVGRFSEICLYKKDSKDNPNRIHKRHKNILPRQEV